MDFLLFAIALLLLLMAGCGAALLLIRSRRTNVLELLSLSVLCGSAVVSLLSFWMGLLISGPQLRWTVAIAALASGTLSVVAWQRRKVLWWPIDRRIDLLLAGLVLIQILTVTWISLRLPLGYDGLIVWELKARLIFLSGGVMPFSFYGDATKFFHPHYPLLLPLTEAWFYGWLGRREQGLLKLIFPLFYLAAAGMLYVGGARLTGQRWRGFLSAGLLFLIPSVLMRVSSGEADFPLGVFYLAAVVYLLEYWRTGETEVLPLVAGLSAILPWVKLEGTILWLCLVLLAGVKAAKQKDWRAFLLIVLPGAALLGGWYVFLKMVQASATKVYLPVTLGNLWANLGRGPVIAQSVVREMMNWRSWSLLWLAPLLALPLLKDKRCREPISALLGAVILPVVLYSSIYLFTAWNPFTLHIQASLSRLLTQLSPVVLLLLVMSIPGISRPGNNAAQAVEKPEQIKLE